MITKMAATVNLFVDTADIYIQVALAWLLRNPTVTSPIIGASTVEQLQELLSAVGWSLPEEIAQRLDMLTAWDRD
jgi:aryl-alcohol dehydrogenase-like predicted oxidoreductase